MRLKDLLRWCVWLNGLAVFVSPIMAQPVLTEGGLTEKVINPTGTVDVFVVDGQGFGENQHGTRITATFNSHTEVARLVQLSGSATYTYESRTIGAINAAGLIHHSLGTGSGIFWTSTDSSPAYSTSTTSQWEVESDGARPFHKTSVLAAKWLSTQDILFISSLENPTIVSGQDQRQLYCDDYPHIHRTDFWIPYCGSLDDYIAHNGVAIDRTIFTGAILAGKMARSGVRAGGKFDQNAIYVEALGGQTSHAAPVLAAYATNLSFNNPSWGAAKLKEELFKLATDETLPHSDGGTRTVKVIRPANAPTATAPTAPEAPSNLTATASGRTKINLSWTVPSENGGANISGYKIEASSTGTSGWTDLVTSTGSPPTTTYSDSNLAPETTRYYRVSAINSIGTGVPSNIASATTEPPTAPDAPTSLIATASGRTIINLAWTAPSDDGGAAISKYKIEVSPDGDASTWEDLVDDIGSTSTSYAHENLDPETTRYYRVSATNSVGTGDPSNIDHATTEAVTTPEAPASFIATSSGRTIINLSWVAPSNDGGATISGYKVEMSPNGTSLWTDLVANTGSGSTTTYAHENLPPATTRYYRVSAINSEGPGAPSTVDGATTDALNVPDEPTSLTATALGRTMINLSWKAPLDNGGADISGYKIEVSPDGDASTWEDLVDDTELQSTSYSHENLAPATTRYYRVSAINSVGAGDPSNTDHATTDALKSPGAPTSLTAIASGRTIINLSWIAPSEDGGAAIMGYNIQISPNGTSNWTDLVANTVSESITYAHENLVPSTTHHYRIRAINSVGPGPPSNTDSAITDARTVPSPPTGLVATASGRAIINLAWKPPSDDGGATISGYRIEVSPDGVASNWEDLVADTQSNSTSYAHENLNPETTRHYRVSAINIVGTGNSSNAADATTDAVTVTIPDAPTSLSASSSGRTIITLSWKAPSNNGGSDISGYRIEESTNPTSSGWTAVVSNTESRLTTYDHENLAPSTTHHYRVRAINSIGGGPFSNTSSTSTEALAAPDAPTDLIATASGRTVINLSWKAPSDNGGAVISGYQIEVSPNGTSNWTDLVANSRSASTSHAHENLPVGTTRYYQIRAINTIGTGPVSNISSATTDALTAPDAPTELSATSSGPTSINLSWKAPSSNGGSAISGYRIEVSPNGTSSWTDLVSHTRSRSTTYVHENLAPSTTRYYRISAINSTGTGAVSNVSSARTDALTTPDAPTGLTATATGRTTIYLSWTAPSASGGAIITGYKIEVSADEGSTWMDLVENTDSRVTVYTHAGLDASTTRHYQVSAINSAGTGISSNIDSATTNGLTVPDAPTSFTASSSGQTTINLSWNPPSNNGGATITGYHIEVSADGTTNWTDLVANTASTATIYAHTGLTASTTRSYRVSAINAVGIGGPSAISTVTTDAETITLPDAPVSLTATASGQSTILLSWDAPSNNGGSVVSGYTIEVSPNGSSNWTDLVSNTRSRSTTYSHENLAPNTTNYYRISAINSVGTGPASLIAGATTNRLLTLSMSGGINRQRYPVGVEIAEFALPIATGGVAPYTYTLFPSTLPEGLSYNEVLRTINGTPSQITTPPQSFVWGVTDAVGSESTLQFTIEVYTISFTEGIENQSYTRDQPIAPLVLPDIIGGIDPIQYTLTIFALPSNLRFDLPTRTISGTPSQVTPPVDMVYKAQDAMGAEDSLTFTIEVVSPVHNEEPSSLPKDFIVHSNYPNPFTHSTRLVFDVPWSALVRLEIMDMTGRQVYIMPEVSMSSGKGQVIELNDLRLPSGAYLYRMIATSLDGQSYVHVGHLMSIR